MTLLALLSLVGLSAFALAVTDQKIHKDAKVAIEYITCRLVTAVGQADVKVYSFLPGHSFEIVSVQGYVRTVVAALSLRVKISGVAALAADIAPVSGTRADGALAAALAGRRGGKADTIDFHYTTDGTGVGTDAFIVVGYRAVPLNNEIFTE
jgi:hypothetical protein